MTRDALIALVGARLGDTSSAFDTVLEDYFDRVLEELAANECIRSLRKTNTTQFTASTATYSSRTICGMSSPDYPVDIIRLLVPAWGPTAGRLIRLEEEQFLLKRLAFTDSTGAAVTGQPMYWCLYPNDQQLYVTPTPSSSYVVTNQLEVHYIAPPTVIAGGTDITEIRREHIPVLIAGMVAHGANFQDETLPDLKTARQQFEVGMARMKGLNHREHGRGYRTAYRDL